MISIRTAALGLAALALLGTAAVRPAQAQELVTNGGFETGDFSGWTQGGNTGATGVATNYAQSGSYGVYLGPVGSDGTLSQVLTTTPGQDYDISFWLFSDGGTPSDFRASFGDTLLFSAANLPAHSYQQYTYTANASSASTPLTFSFRNDPSYLGLDNVSVRPSAVAAVPEPSQTATLGLGALGLAGLAFTARRKARAL